MKKFEVNNEIAVIFCNSCNDNYDIYLKPLKIVKGYMDYKNQVFVDSENNGYVHISNNVSINRYGLRCEIDDLKEKYKTKNLEEAIKKFWNDLQKFELHTVLKHKEGVFYKIVIDGYNKHNKKHIEFIDKDFNKIKVVYDEKNDNFFMTSVDNDYIDDIDDIFENNQNVDYKKVSFETKKIVIGQDEAIDKLITTLWSNFNSQIKNNIIIAGSTGVGKTAIIRAISNKVGRFFYKTHVNGLSQTGYVGDSVKSILKGLLVACDYNLDIASNAVVFLDEFDKIAASKGGEVSTLNVQNELLTVIEDGEYLIETEFEDMLLPTKDITFIGAGTFDGIIKKEKKNIGFENKNVKSENSIKKYSDITSEDLINYGFIPELIGRMPVIIGLNELMVDDFIKIMKSSDYSVLKNKIDVLKKVNIDVIIDEDAYLEMANKALKNNTGARGLNAVVDNTFSKILEDVVLGNGSYDYVHITKDTVNNPKLFKSGFKLKDKMAKNKMKVRIKK